jgi:hypothetical protein
MIKCVIIEDEPQAVNLLRNIMASNFPNVVSKETESNNYK